MERLPRIESISQAPPPRRDFLRAGSGLAMAGFTLPFLGVRGTQAADAAAILPRQPARSCILVYLLGGPPHLDMWDLKPEAPSEIRGPFRPIPTTVPGFQICEHLPRLAKIAHKYATIRSVSHPNDNHTPMIYYTLTGKHTAQPSRDNDIRPPQRSDFPHTGAVLAKFKPSPLKVGYVALPEVAIRSSTKGEYKRARLPLRGGSAGFLGPHFDPFTVNAAPDSPRAVPALRLPESIAPERFERRRALLSALESAVANPFGADYASFRETAIALTGTHDGGVGRLFSLADERPAVRERYGRHRFGQSLLLARRLAEAGVPMVSIHFNEMTVCDGWDTHSKNHEALEDELLPLLDQGLSALIEDLDQRGTLDETLVVCLGEFGRTPKINKKAGRDHWGSCSTAVLAGAGVVGGRVLGASDKHAAFPVDDPFDPVDIQATVYHTLGLDPHTPIHDHFGRPFPISDGSVIDALF